MRRPQFSLKTLLWLMVVVAAFFGGMVAESKVQAMRRQHVVGPPVYFPDGHVETEFFPKYPWLHYLPDDWAATQE